MAAAGMQRIIEAGHGQDRLPIDIAYLSRQTLGDPGLEQEVLRLFDVMSHVYMGRLEDATTREALLQHLHTLKGAAAGVGATMLAERVEAAEASLLRGEPVDPERIEDLRLAVEEVSAFISDRIEAA